MTGLMNVRDLSVDANMPDNQTDRVLASGPFNMRSKSPAMSPIKLMTANLSYGR